MTTIDLNKYFLDPVDERYFTIPDPAKRILFTQFCDELRNVDVVFGHDTDTGKVFLAYGKDVLQASKDGKAQWVSIILVNLRQATPELEILLVTLNAVKGSNDYTGEVGDAVEWLERLFVVDGMTRTKATFE
jgi:hypothetical protein